MDYDVFLSYASEDKSVMQELATHLQNAGLRVWLDSIQVSIGDDIADEINKGLMKSRYGVVLLSKIFLEKKKWTKRELNALLNRQAASGKTVILPVLHGLSPEELATYSSLLAGIHAARTSDGIEFVAKQIVEKCTEKDSEDIPSVFRDSSGNVGWREKCMEVIRRNNIIEWRRLVADLADPIPDQLKNWKQVTGDIAAHKGGKDWQDALLQAANICIPAFIPIFSAVEAGNRDYWRESLGIVKQLIILRHEMGGGSTRAIHVGYHMLYVVNSLGVSIATSLRLLDMVNDWMALKVPSMSGNGEELWLQMSSAHYLPDGVSRNMKEPFQFEQTISMSESLRGFFPNQSRLDSNLLMANLLSSMIEFRFAHKNTTSWDVLKNNRKGWHFDVPPIWCFTPLEQFRRLTLDLFGDSDGVINFVSLQRKDKLESFWTDWEIWHKRCVQYLDQGGRYDLFDARFMRLPGQPDWHDDSD